MVSKDLSGMVFGELVAIEKSGRNKHGRFMWRCQCSCGKESIVDIGNLTNGHTTSCGHLKHDKSVWGKNKIDLTGQRFGRLTVISEAERNGKSDRARWLCQCDCGKQTTVYANNLTRRHTLSCGCYSSEIRVTSNITHGLSNTASYKNMQGRRRKEKKKAIDCKWTAEMEVALSSLFQKCVVCGSVERLATDHVLPLDRGNGLRPGNATRLCIHCNSIKSYKPLEELSDDMRISVLESSIAFKKYWDEITGDFSI